MTLEARTQAMAGALQYAYWAMCIATHGEQQPQRMLMATDSLLCTDPKRAVDVFGSAAALKPGLELLQCHLTRQADSGYDAQIMRQAERIVGQLLRHASQLLQLPSKLDDIGQSLQPLQRSRAEHAQLQDGWINDLAGLYKKHISPMQPRILVNGNALYLQNEAMAAGIRCLLFAALRACVLWRQSGGRFWQLVFAARSMRDEVQRQLTAIA